MSNPSDISQSSVSSAKPKNTVSLSYNSHSLLKVVAVIVLLVIAFWGGTVYGRHHTVATSKSAFSLRSGFGGFSHGGGFGTVSAISASSITVDNSRTGQSTSYAITSSTKITDNGQSAAASSIATGERVVVVPSTSNSSDAASILVNPSFGGFGGGSSTGGAPGSATQGSASSTTTQ